MTAADYAGLRALRRDPDLKRLEELLGEFNLFDVLNIGHLELQHSWVIAWLLDPRGSHGLSDYFLRAFLSQAASVAQERGAPVPSPDDVAGWRFSSVEVARERFYIDILALSEDDHLACIIENKIFSGEIPGQLRWYLETVKRTYPSLTPFPIFLTPEGREPLEERDRDCYVPFDYVQVADIIDRTLGARESIISAPVRSFLEQYTRTLRRHILDAPTDIDELAFRLYINHREALDLVMKAYSSSTGLGWDIIDEAMETLGPHLKPDQHGRVYHNFFAACLDEIPALQEGSGWTASGRIVLFQVGRVDTTRELRLWIGPGPEDTRRRVFKVAQDTGLPFLESRSDTPFSPFHWVYGRTILTDSHLLDRDKARTEVRRAVLEFFEQDFWPLVNGIREEFGVGPASAEGN